MRIEIKVKDGHLVVGLDARMFNQSLRNAIYARFSSDNQRDTSVEDQVRTSREFVKNTADGSITR